MLDVEFQFYVKLRGVHLFYFLIFVTKEAQDRSEEGKFDVAFTKFEFGIKVSL